MAPAGCSPHDSHFATVSLSLSYEIQGLFPSAEVSHHAAVRRASRCPQFQRGQPLYVDGPQKDIGIFGTSALAVMAAGIDGLPGVAGTRVFIGEVLCFRVVVGTLELVGEIIACLGSRPGSSGRTGSR